MPAHLDRIIDRHRRAAAADDRDLDQLLANAASAAPVRDFAAELSRPGLSVIAEIKRRSPSAGELNAALDPGALAAAYRDGGARCLSVLTDEPDFGGSPADLAGARAAVPLPVLRKDFTVDPRDVADARIMGADAMLLIVRALGQSELVALHQLATSLGLCPLVEAHTEDEVKRGLDAGAVVIGINQRNLQTFALDNKQAEQLRSSVPDGVTAVAESAIRDATDVRRLVDVGYDAMLIGTSLVTSKAPEELLQEMVAVPCS